MVERGMNGRWRPRVDTVRTGAPGRRRGGGTRTRQERTRVLQSLDSGAARRWAVSSLAALGEAREEIDALNVFPIPDGDTGTNMYLTLEAAVSAAETVPDS